ncbi:MAG: hypothetical protein V1775_13530 [Bacteroidota bacterium]
MKKQLLLVLFLALFAGISSLNAQCVSDGFTPAAGVPYTYDVTIAGTGYSGAGAYDWYVTQDVNILNAANIIPEVNVFFTVDEVTPGYSDYHDAGGATSNQINISWTPAAVSSPNAFYLVLRYSEDNTTSTPLCNAENIRVWQIDPINTFLLAIEGATTTGDPFANAEQCAAPVTGADVTYNPDPLLSTVEYTYGENAIFYRVTASGILGEWRPSIQIPALNGLGQTYLAVEWNDDITGAGTWYPFVGAAGTNLGGNYASADADLAEVLDAVAGTPILIRIRIDNANYETLLDQPILVGIDGHLPTGFIESDIWGGVGPVPDPCDQADPFAKTATYTILARPTITPGATMPAFIQKLP